MKHEAALSATVQHAGEDYLVRYRIQGDVGYVPEVLGRAPEDCSPAECYAEIELIDILSVQDANTDETKVGVRLRQALLASLRKLPLADYLLENWQQSDA